MTGKATITEHKKYRCRFTVVVYSERVIRNAAVSFINNVLTISHPNFDYRGKSYKTQLIKSKNGFQITIFGLDLTAGKFEFEIEDDKFYIDLTSSK